METLGYARHSKEGRRAYLENPSRLQTGEATPTSLRRGKVQGHGEEIAKLSAAGFIREVHHLEWLSSPVLVRKKSGKWRMCVDYTGLNKACPKDPFPLPRIDQIVDSTSGYETLCFLDAYSGYHQIMMKESDQLATSVIAPFELFCYITMSFIPKKHGGYISVLYAQVFWGPHRENR